jgi:hypothetical protein
MSDYLEAFLNDFAIRSFRDIADGDYICARMAYRTRLVSQFHWSSLQAMEKYLKCILLLNRVPAKDLRHDLSKALELAKEKLPFSIRLSEKTLHFVTHLDTFGRHRYFETPYWNRGIDIVTLDRAVWEIRRYCQRINYCIALPGGAKKDLCPLNIQSIEAAETRPYQDFSIMGGVLEDVLKSNTHPAREALIWRNLRYGRTHRKKVRLSPYWQAANSPLSLHPDMVDEVLKFVFLPKDVAEFYREQARKEAQADSVR